MIRELLPQLSKMEWFGIGLLGSGIWLYWVYLAWRREQEEKKMEVELSPKMNKVAFAREVIRWCMQHLGLPKGKRTGPRLLLRYYRHRKVMGTYQQRSKTITLYWGSHASLKEVVNTLIHEYQHFLDIRTSQEDKAYDKELKQIGYQDNSYEKRARQVADRWEKACIQALAQKGFIK